MTDTQTAFVLVPREPTDEMLEASVSPRDEFLTDAHVSVLKEGFAAKYRAMLSAAPKPPESEIGPVAWRVKPWRHHGSEWMLATVVPECAQEEPAQPLYPQARIDADAAEKAELLARVKELEGALEPFAAAVEYIGIVDGDLDTPDWSPFIPLGAYRRAALASKKETVDE